MSRPRRLVLLAAPVAAALALAGCSAADGDELSWEDSPLNAYLSAAYGGDLSPEEQEQRWQEQRVATEEFVAECMSDEGFEYIPVTDTGAISVGGDQEWDPESRDWVSQYGYGFVNWPGRDEPTPPEDVMEDPNQDYVNALSPSEQEAYWATLHGPAPTEEELNDDGSYEYDWTTAGCYGAAQHEVMGEDPYNDDEFQPLMDAMNTFYTDMQNAPEMAELDAEWASCMADGGHPDFTKQTDAQDSIMNRMNEIWEDPEATDQEELLEAIGEDEIALALVDLECRDKVDYRQQQLVLQFELEERFIEDHKAELEAFKAAAEQAR